MRELTEQDVNMFYVMESMKRLSKCVDKQVVCLIVNEAGAIVSSGVNTVLECDKNCHDKANRTCIVDHAEVVAVRHLPFKDLTGRTAYVSLFPCKSCQELIDPFVDEIVTFGMAHKEWVSDKIFVYAHPVYSVDMPEDRADYSSGAYEVYTVRGRIRAQEKIRDFYETSNRRQFESFKKVLVEHTERGVSAYTKSNYKH